MRKKVVIIATLVSLVFVAFSSNALAQPVDSGDMSLGNEVTVVGQTSGQANVISADSASPNVVVQKLNKRPKPDKTPKPPKLKKSEKSPKPEKLPKPPKKDKRPKRDKSPKP